MNFRQREMDIRVANERKHPTRCDMCIKARAARCWGPCALRDIAAQMRKASQEREEVPNA
jgi:hypothetical protein